jgi:outer membrane cobalamin receptor
MSVFNLSNNCMLKKTICLVIFILFFSFHAKSQSDSLNVRNLSRDQILNLTTDQLISLPLEDVVYLAGQLGMTIDELLNKQITVGSKKQLTPRETPGIISVITREEIVKSGARDLIDVLQLVPGISFGYDLDGVIGLAMRGIWGLEGKILIMIDGIELNEGMYSTVNFGNHFSPEQIQQIEIIRGPGSSLYGGYAELGVINIITRNADEISGVNISKSFGTMEETIGHENLNLQGGFKAGNTEFTMLYFYGAGNRSDLNYTTFDGDTFALKDTYSSYRSTNFNLAVKNKGLCGRVIVDDYKTNITGYAEGVSNNFTNIFSDLSYKININKKINLTPQLTYQWQMPYHLEDTAWFYKKTFARVRGGIDMNYDVAQKLNFIVGAEYYSDLAKDLSSDSAIFYNNKKQITFNNYSTYLQGILKLGNFNFIGGSRFDYHSQAGTKFSPRVGVTSIFNKIHFKLLYSNAFRAPSIENLNLNQGIKPEKTRVFEFETGYRISSHMFLTANIFDITIKDPIVYVYNPETEEENYLNFEKTGSEGIELNYNILFTKIKVDAGYSYYNSNGKNTVDPYSVYYPDNTLNSKYLQGMSDHKATLSVQYSPNENLCISSNLTYWGKKYGFVDNDTLQNEVGPVPIWNMFFSYNNLFIDNLTIGFGIYNILDEKMLFIQPYGTNENVSAPYPGPTREYLIRITYKFETDKMKNK